MTQSVSIGGRLREERQRLDMSQPAFGEVGGVTKKTQMLYEAGERFPDAAYLSAAAGAGADVLYILTGLRSESHAAISAIRQASELAAKLGGSKEEQAFAMQALFEQLQQDRLSAEEREVLSLYRAAPLAVRAAVIGALTAGPQTAPVKVSSKGKGATGLVNYGDGAVQVGRAGGKVTVKKG
jgi:transcriptional regulator with XRE-family HTH domain